MFINKREFGLCGILNNYPDLLLIISGTLFGFWKYLCYPSAKRTYAAHCGTPFARRFYSNVSSCWGCVTPLLLPIAVEDGEHPAPRFRGGAVSSVPTEFKYLASQLHSCAKQAAAAASTHTPELPEASPRWHRLRVSLYIKRPFHFNMAMITLWNI